MRWKALRADEVTAPKAWPAAVGALLLFVLDAYCFNQGVLAGAVALYLLAVRLPRSFRRRFAPVRRQRLRNIAVYVTASVLVFVANHFNNAMARERAETLVEAVQAFQAAHGSYPTSLEDLVPEFLDCVPPAKFAAVFDRFSYGVVNGDAFLFYVEMPPFGRPIYWFNSHRWSYVD